MNHVCTKIFAFAVMALLAGCSNNSLFSGYRKDVFPVTRVTEKNVKTIQIMNDSGKDVQHIISVAFYANSNKDGHFQVTKALVGTELVGQKDIFVPPMGVLNLEVTYAPLNLETTAAEFGGWVTTAESRGEKVSLDEISGAESGEEEAEPKGALLAMVKLAADSGTTADNASNEIQDTSNEYEPAIHRAMLVVAYDKAKEGYVHVELVGEAVPGPNGEATAVAMGGGGGGECIAGGTTACFDGTFSIDLPGLMSGGAKEVPMGGPIPFTIEGSSVTLDMNKFPPVLIALKGNGPGEPLEGKPVDAVSIIISGTENIVATGTFDGGNLSLADVGFRVRVLLGEITYEDINPSLATAVDFNITGLEITTAEPFDGSKIVFGVETTLSAEPSGNGLFDAFLGNARVVVKFTGMLELP